jgi:hypothetical protein
MKLKTVLPLILISIIPYQNSNQTKTSLCDSIATFTFNTAQARDDGISSIEIKNLAKVVFSKDQENLSFALSLIDIVYETSLNPLNIKQITYDSCINDIK